MRYYRLPEETPGLVPEPLGRRGVKRVVAYPVDAVDDGRDDLRLVAALEVAPVDVLDQRGAASSADVAAPCSGVFACMPTLDNISFVLDR